MADMGEARSTTRDAVVRPLSRVAVRPCARPGCPSPARATLSFRYATREAWLEALHGESSPATYDLCGGHADRTRPPTGWAIVDERPAEDQAPAEHAPARDLGDAHTVAVLAAALRAVPDRPAEPAVSVAPEPLDAAAHEDRALADLAREDVPVGSASAAELRDVGLDHVDLDQVDLPPEVRDGIEDALAELAAVARRDGPEQIAIALDDDRSADDDRRHDRPDGDAGGASPRPEQLVPRPVRAARERAGDDAPGGPARTW